MMEENKKMSRSAKNTLIGLCAVIIIALIVGVIILCMSIKVIPAGYDGVVYSMNGGVQKEVLQQGWHVVAPGKTVKKFTISNEQLLLTKDKREGSTTNESFSVATSDDASIAISFQMTYQFKEDTLVETYKKFRGMDGESIVNNRVKSVLKSKISEITTDYSIMDIYSGNRNEINTKLTEYLDKCFQVAYGIHVLDASIIDSHPDDELKKSIDARVTALQEKQKAQAEQETVKVQAQTALIKAQNEANIKLTEAEAEAKANKLKSDSITDKLIRMKEAEARLEHGWVEIQGVDTVVKDK